MMKFTLGHPPPEWGMCEYLFNINLIIYILNIFIPLIFTFWAYLVHVFKHIFSVFKQYYIYFYTLFH